MKSATRPSRQTNCVMSRENDESIPRRNTQGVNSGQLQFSNMPGKWGWLDDQAFSTVFRSEYLCGKRTNGAQVKVSFHLYEVTTN